MAGIWLHIERVLKNLLFVRCSALSLRDFSFICGPSDVLFCEYNTLRFAVPGKQCQFAWYVYICEAPDLRHETG